MRWILPALALLLAGCASTSWQKPLASGAQQSVDLTACGVTARRDAAAAAPHALGPPRISLGRSDIANPAADFPEELLVQQSLRNECMRERGWRLTQAAQVP